MTLVDTIMPWYSYTSASESNINTVVYEYDNSSVSYTLYIHCKNTTDLPSLYYGIATALFKSNINKPLLDEIIIKPQEAAIRFPIVIVL